MHYVRSTNKTQYNNSINAGTKNKMKYGLSLEQQQDPTTATPISIPNKHFKEFEQTQYPSSDSFITKNNNQEEVCFSTLASQNIR